MYAANGIRTEPFTYDTKILKEETMKRSMCAILYFKYVLIGRERGYKKRKMFFFSSSSSFEYTQPHPTAPQQHPTATQPPQPHPTRVGGRQPGGSWLAACQKPPGWANRYLYERGRGWPPRGCAVGRRAVGAEVTTLPCGRALMLSGHAYMRSCAHALMRSCDHDRSLRSCARPIRSCFRA